jgi:hypothetical protein
MGDVMAKSTDLNTSGPVDAAATPADSREQRLVAFAEQLGWIVGTVQGKAEGWLNSEAMTAQISKVRDSASALLEQLRPTQKAGAAKSSPRAKAVQNDRKAGNTKVSSKGKVASKVRASATSGLSTRTGNKGRSGGVVDAPGKKHRKPVPSESGATGSPRGQGERLAKLKALNQNRVQRRG